jgi:hypothetical protein
MLKIPKYSIGVGDRFGRQGRAQLQAIKTFREGGITVVPVWNKSFREHSIVGTQPINVRREADTAASAEGWTAGYFVDADHINLRNVETFIGASDFFTLDVADAIGKTATDNAVAAFVKRHADLIGQLKIKGLAHPLEISKTALAAIARKYLVAVDEAVVLYRHIASHKSAGSFITEVSMDEVQTPQTPTELLVILAALADEQIPVQTIAPKFTGRFNKGVDYVGDPAVFSREFSDDICVVQHAIQTFGLPANLKLSVHSGSDKFSIYGGMAAALERHNAGVHLKTAGTTWLEEVVGLAESGGEGLAVARDIYARALPRFAELCGPYVTVVDISHDRLPPIEEVMRWDAEMFVRSLRHIRHDPLFNPDFRQFLHVSYRVAAEMGARFTEALEDHQKIVARNVLTNLLERHLKPLFGKLKA